MTDPTPEDKAVALAEKYFLKSAKDYKDGAYYCDNADVIAMLADHEQQVREAIATMQTQNEEHLKDKVAMAMANEQLQARVGQLEGLLARAHEHFCVPMGLGPEWLYDPKKCMQKIDEIDRKVDALKADIDAAMKGKK